jgi:hypothetical protein
MYRYLDRLVGTLEPAQRLLVWAMRNWVAAASQGRCPCARLGAAFESCGVGEALSDFNTAMLVLNGEGVGALRLAPLCGPQVRDDEARLLALFAAGLGADDRQLHRLADQLVRPDAVWHLITAVERVTATLSTAPQTAARPFSRDAGQ